MIHSNKKKTYRKYFVFLSLIILFFYNCNSKSQEVKEKKSTTVIKEKNITEVSVIKLKKSTFNHEIISNGKLSAKKKAILRFAISNEPITHIWVKNGDYVRRGQKIADLDKQRLQLSLKKSKLNLERARLELQNVLIGQGYRIADSTSVPANVLKLARIRSGYDNAELEYLSTQNRFKNATLLAPISGKIANLTIKPYNIPSGDFCTLIDDRELEIIFTVMENELSLIKRGQKVAVSLFSNNTVTVVGYISEINPMINASGLVTIKAVIGNRQDRFYEGMNVRVKIRKEIPNKLIVPKKAVVLRDTRQVVFTVKNNHAYWNYVTTQLENSEYYTISKGLSEGDSVIIDGNLHLAHESPIKVNK